MMEKQKREGTATNPGRVSKVPYATPRLTDFGSVETLSLGGTSGANETPGNMSLTKKM